MRAGQPKGMQGGLGERRFSVNGLCCLNHEREILHENVDGGGDLAERALHHPWTPVAEHPGGRSPAAKYIKGGFEPEALPFGKGERFCGSSDMHPAQKLIDHLHPGPSAR